MKLQRFHRAPSPRRGVAMLLVLVALAAATIMSTAYLASRDNSAGIGMNSAFMTEARWASLSGIELAVAIMETETDWRTAHVDGKILDDYPIGGGTIDIDVLDLVTEMPPTAETVSLRVTSSATVQGLTQVSSAIAAVMPTDGDCAHVDLSEFAIYSGSTIELNDTATVSRWSSAPTGDLGRRINVGALGTNASTVNLTGNSAIIDPSVYLTKTASPSAIAASADQGARRWDLGSALPMPAPPTAPAPATPGTDDVVVKTTSTITGTSSLNSASIISGGTLTITGDSSLFVTDNLVLTGGGMVIDGNVVIAVQGNVSVTTLASIELTAGSTLTLFVGGTLQVTDGYIGSERPDTETFDASGDAHYAAPSQLQIYEGAGSSAAWAVSGNSVVKASVYAPNKDLSIAGTSAIYGRVAGSSVTLSNEGSLFYDHALADPYGYTNPDCVVWAPSGQLVSDVANLPTMDPSDLQTLSDALGVTVTAGEVEVAPASPPADTPAPAEGATTPRTVPVSVEVTAFGFDPESWEEQAVVRTEVDSGAVETKSNDELSDEADELTDLALHAKLEAYRGNDNDERLATRAEFLSRIEELKTAVAAGEHRTAIGASWRMAAALDGKAVPTPDVLEDSSEKKHLSERLTKILKYCYKKTNDAVTSATSASAVDSKSAKEASKTLLDDKK